VILLRPRLDRQGLTGILAQSMLTVDLDTRVGLNSIREKYAFGNSGDPLGPLPIHADPRGNPPTPSLARNDTLSPCDSSGSLPNALLTDERRWQRHQFSW
jgi:hypothetical protein